MKDFYKKNIRFVILLIMLTLFTILSNSTISYFGLSDNFSFDKFSDNIFSIAFLIAFNLFLAKVISNYICEILKVDKLP